MARPNILVFLTDDHARWAVPAYGNTHVVMPNLDGLAARGTVFEDASTATPVCSPARASFMTGLMPCQHGVHDFLQSQPRFGERDWLAGVPTLATILAEDGYDCGLVGKWHIGQDSTPQPGFSNWFALNGEYPIHHDGDNGFSRNGVPERETGNLTDIITREACASLDARDRTRPFFLTVGYYATHSPWADQPARFKALHADHDFAEIPAGSPAPGPLNVELPEADPASRQSARVNYYAAASHIDAGIGAILGRLADQGALDNTLIVYTADHGLSLGQHGVWGKGNATRPLNMLDPNLRIPLIMAGPGVPAGARRAGYVDHTDMFATLVGYAGAGAGRTPLGQDVLSPRWIPRDIQFGEYGPVRMARTASHKLLISGTQGTRRLFRLEGDDEVDVTDHPESGPVIGALSAEIDRFFGPIERPERSGPAAFRRETYNLNQAWDDFVPVRP